MIDAVIKIGGSLRTVAPWSDLRCHLTALARRWRLLLLPGGGLWADMVRAVDAAGDLSKSSAHWMAILAMDLYGFWLADRLDVTPLRDLTSLDTLPPGRAPQLLLPFDLLYRRDPLPHSWDVTSDSIAAWLAKEVGAPLLVLLKDVDGLSVTPGLPPLPDITIDALATCGGVDCYLAQLLAGSEMSLWVLNGRFPARLDAVLAGQRPVGTRFSPEAPSARPPFPPEPSPGPGSPRRRPSGSPGRQGRGG